VKRPTSTGEQLILYTASELLEARRLWQANAARVHFGVCQGCGRSRNDEGRPLLVVRQEKARRFFCLACYMRERKKNRGRSS